MNWFRFQKTVLTLGIAAISVVGCIYLFTGSSANVPVAETPKATGNIKYFPGEESKGTAVCELHFDADGKKSEMRVKFVDGIECVVYYDSLERIVRVKELGNVLCNTGKRMIQTSSGILYTFKPNKPKPYLIECHYDSGNLLEEIRLADDGSMKAFRYADDSKKTRIQELATGIDGTFERIDFWPDGTTREVIYRKLKNECEIHFYNEKGVLRCVSNRPDYFSTKRVGQISFLRDDGVTPWFEVTEIDLWGRPERTVFGNTGPIKEFYPDGKTLYRSIRKTAESDSFNFIVDTVGEAFNKTGVLTQKQYMPSFGRIELVENIGVDGRISGSELQSPALVDTGMEEFAKFCTVKDVLSKLMLFPSVPPIQIDLRHVQGALLAP